jgi:hypothetical protein
MQARRAVFLFAAIAAAAGLASVVAVQMARYPTPSLNQEAQVSQTPAEKLPPSLDCAFRPFMHTSAGVYFYFDVAFANDKSPRFYQRALVAADGSRTAYQGDGRLLWTYGHDTDGKPVITSPDAATRIVLYGLKLGAPGEIAVEAGIRSNTYRNLGGECRQTNLDGDGL